MYVPDILIMTGRTLIAIVANFILLQCTVFSPSFQFLLSLYLGKPHSLSDIFLPYEYDIPGLDSGILSSLSPNELYNLFPRWRPKLAVNHCFTRSNSTCSKNTQHILFFIMSYCTYFPHWLISHYMNNAAFSNCDLV